MCYSIVISWGVWSFLIMFHVLLVFPMFHTDYCITYGLVVSYWYYHLIWSFQCFILILSLNLVFPMFHTDYCITYGLVVSYWYYHLIWSFQCFILIIVSLTVWLFHTDVTTAQRLKYEWLLQTWWSSSSSCLIGYNLQWSTEMILSLLIANY